VPDAPPENVKVVLRRGRKASFAETRAAAAGDAAEMTTFVVPASARPGRVVEGWDELGRKVKVPPRPPPPCLRRPR
jgi:hypothetical protein